MGKFANSAAEMRAISRIAAEAMGEEYDETDGNSLDVGTCIGPIARCAKWHGESGFEAMGHMVPAFRRTAGEAHMKAMGFDRPGDSERRHDIVARMAASLERDNSHEALEAALKSGLDVTGCYRLMSVLLCEPQPVQMAPEPATFLDLVA